MKYDQPLRAINNKLPNKKPSYYLKLLLVVFVSSILASFILMALGINEQKSGIVAGIIATLILPCFLAGILSKLYNTKTKTSDSVIEYLPQLANLKSFKKVSYGFSSLVRFLLVLYAYLLLVLIILLPISAVFSVLSS